MNVRLFNVRYFRAYNEKETLKLSFNSVFLFSRQTSHSHAELFFCFSPFLFCILENKPEEQLGA